MRASTLWNFFEASSINLDRAFNGAGLAPGAHLTNSTIISGAVWVDSFTQNGEVHLPFSTVVIPTPGAAVFSLAAGLFGRTRRRNG